MSLNIASLNQIFKKKNLSNWIEFKELEVGHLYLSIITHDKNVLTKKKGRLLFIGQFTILYSIVNKIVQYAVLWWFYLRASIYIYTYSTCT